MRPVGLAGWIGSQTRADQQLVITRPFYAKFALGFCPNHDEDLAGQHRSFNSLIRQVEQREPIHPALAERTLDPGALPTRAIMLRKHLSGTYRLSHVQRGSSTAYLTTSESINLHSDDHVMTVSGLQNRALAFKRKYSRRGLKYDF